MIMTPEQHSAHAWQTWAETLLLSLSVVIFNAFHRTPLFALWSALAVQICLCLSIGIEMHRARRRYLEALEEYLMRGGTLMLVKRRGGWHIEPIKRPDWLP